MKIYQNIECGNLLISYGEALKEARELYDFEDDTNIVSFNELYRRIEFPTDEAIYWFIKDNPGIHRMEIISELLIDGNELDAILNRLRRARKIYTNDNLWILNCIRWFAM